MRLGQMIRTKDRSRRSANAPDSPIGASAAETHPVVVAGNSPHPMATLALLPQPTLAPARHNSRLRPSAHALSFIAVVLLPIAAAAFYLFAVAADQYIAEFRFSLSNIDPPRFDPLSLLAGNAGHSPAALESQIVVQFIASRALVEELDARLDLRRLFSPPDADWWARLDPAVSIERLVHYWQGQVDPFYDPANGTVVVRVRAFVPADALRLAQAIVAASENLVNDMSARSRHDAVAQAEADVAQAEHRLQAILGDIRAFRDREGLIDPGKSADGMGSLAARLRDELVRTNAELATLKNYMSEDAPAVRLLEARIRSLEAQRAAVNRDLTDAGQRDDTLSRLLGAYEQLESDRHFAEVAYQHAMQGLDQARANVDRQQVYIVSFVPPALPEEALYPRRWRSIGVVALIAFAVWGIGGLALQSIRDHF